jgi:glucosamine-6-phosphate deaminase
MEIIILKNAEEVAATGAELVAELLRVSPATVLGLATGGTQLALYRQLVAKNLAAEISFRKVTTFNLDEYLGVTPDNPQSYRAYMQRELFGRVDIDPCKTFLPECGEGQNPVLVGPLYEQKILAAGGIDLQIMGIGVNGHIGFNEPSSSLNSRTRVKTLTRQTVEDNSRLFSAAEFQPKLAITMGIGTIMDARRILLLATGGKKADAVGKMVEGPLTAMCPASVLQMHQRVTVILDEAAAGGLRNRDYYDWAYLQNESLKDRFGRSNDL